MKQILNPTVQIIKTLYCNNYHTLIISFNLQCLRTKLERLTLKQRARWEWDEQGSLWFIDRSSDGLIAILTGSSQQRFIFTFQTGWIQLVLNLGCNA